MNETRRSLLVSSEWSTIAEHPVAELKEVFAVVGGQLRVLRGGWATVQVHFSRAGIVLRRQRLHSFDPEPIAEQFRRPRSRLLHTQA